MIYQHAAKGRDRQLARELSGLAADDQSSRDHACYSDVVLSGPLVSSCSAPQRSVGLSSRIVIFSTAVGSRGRGVLLTPSTIPLLLIGVGFVTPTVGLWSDSPNLTEFLAGAAFLIAAIGVAAYLAPRAALILTRSGVTPLLRRTVRWREVGGLRSAPCWARL